MLALLVSGALVLMGIAIYNGLVRLRAQADAAWSDVEVQLKRRHALVPKLVETVKGHAAREHGTLDAVVGARNRAVAAAGPAASAEPEGTLTQTLRGMLALADADPELRAAESFAQLQASLDQIEDAIQSARRYYNAVVRDLNTQVGRFPARLVAGALGFTPREIFELADETARRLPRVELDTGTTESLFSPGARARGNHGV